VPRWQKNSKRRVPWRPRRRPEALAAVVSEPVDKGQRPTLVVTRPREEAEAWVASLNERGWPAQSLPLIEIGVPSSASAREALAQARAQWPAFDALMFVSAAAVRHFFAGARATPATRAARTRFWAPGPGTARELVRALDQLGLSADRVDAPPTDAAQFDSEHLWPQVQDQMGVGRRLLVVRGGVPGQAAADTGELAGQGREWLLRQCRQRGAEVQACMAYERRLPHWDDAQRAQLRAATGGGHVWLFSSSEAVANLQQACPGFDAAGTAALATHPRIAAAAQAAGFGPVEISRPALPDVLAALEWHRTLP